MRTLKRILLALLALVVLVVIAAIVFIQFSWNKTYDVAMPELQVSSDSAVIARGKYLVHGPAHCITCHVSGIDDLVRADAGESVALQGGVVFPLGPLGSISPANLTPDPETGIGRYTDGQIFRMMRHAVKPDGSATLAMMMPFWNMADEDLVAVVSYLRSQEPVKNAVPAPQWTFMGKAIRSFAPTFKPITDPTPPATAPPMAPTVERGEYLARYVANCVGCHTRRDPMTFAATGPEYAGGMEFEPWPELHNAFGIDPELWTRSPNITPHPKSAMAQFETPEAWIERFRQGRKLMHSPMHWGPFSRMSDEDLTALWLYLQSLEPVEYEVGEINFKKEQ